tara:strand:- start:593 stop:874 length:282 start_codon:yes stop_codon:yes gene_type:complete
VALHQETVQEATVQEATVQEATVQEQDYHQELDLHLLKVRTTSQDYPTPGNLALMIFQDVELIAPVPTTQIVAPIHARRVALNFRTTSIPPDL